MSGIKPRKAFLRFRYEIPRQKEKKEGEAEGEEGKTESLRRWRAKKRTVKPFCAERSLFITRGNPLCFRRRLESREKENRGRKKGRGETERNAGGMPLALSQSRRNFARLDGNWRNWKMSRKRGPAKSSGRGNSRYRAGCIRTGIQERICFLTALGDALARRR